jgi:hypothetical protein
MPLTPIADRVAVTSTSTGTGNFALGAALLGYRSFGAAFADGPCYYAILDATTGAWEIGLGTLSGTGTVLARTTLLSSSTGAFVSFAAGSKTVYSPVPAAGISAISMPSGTAALPGLPFDVDPDTGLFRITSNTLGITTGGVQRVSISTLEMAVVLPNLTVSDNAPSLNLDDLNGGVGVISDSRVALKGAGTTLAVFGMGGNADMVELRSQNGDVYIRADFTNSTAASVIAFIVDATNTFRALVDATGVKSLFGSITNPGFAFMGDEDVGLFRPTTNQLGLVTAGAEAIRIDQVQRVGVGVTSPSCRLHVSGTIRTTSYTVATLPSAATEGAGARAYVTNALTPSYGAVVAGGGAVGIPVTSNGTNWICT